MVERVKDSTSRVIIYFQDGEMWASNTTNKHLLNLDAISPENNPELKKAVEEHRPYNEKMTISEDESEIMVIGIPVREKRRNDFCFSIIDVINQTKAETTKIIFVAAAIAIVLTTIFAFFLSTRITSPLIQMREAAIDLAKG